MHVRGIMWLNRRVRIIYLSPHLDDAIFSAGGLIRSQTEAGIAVEIWTFMAGFPDDAGLPDFAQAMHQIWGFSSGSETVRSRREEDLAAAALVGAKAVHFDFLDCIYRRGKVGQPLYSSVEVPVHPDEADLPAQIAQTMVAWLHPDDTVVCQLAIGRHVDHVIVRQAAEMLQRPLLTYDADIPYLLHHPGELEPNLLGLRESLQPVSEGNFKCWIAAIECYASQVDSAFGSQEIMRLGMQELWMDQRGIRFWSPQGTT